MKIWKYCIKIEIIRNGKLHGNFLLLQKFSILITHDLKRMTGAKVCSELITNPRHKRFILFSSPDLFFERLRNTWEGKWVEPNNNNIGVRKRKSIELYYRIEFIEFQKKDKRFYENYGKGHIWRMSADNRAIIHFTKSRPRQFIGRVNGNENKQRLTAQQIYCLETSRLPYKSLKIKKFTYSPEDNHKIKKIEH